MIGRLTGVGLPIQPATVPFAGRNYRTNYDMQPLRKGDLAVISTEIRQPGETDSFFESGYRQD